MSLVCPDCLAEVHAAHENCPACGYVRPREGWLADPLSGLILGGRYRLEGRLGAGGMASVFRASRVGALGGQVAVKVLAPRFARTVVARRFEREAQVVSRLTNPHIVRIYDFDSFTFPGHDRGLFYIAMELIEGHTLGQLLRAQGKVNFLWGIDVLRQIARGLEEAHGQGVVHRDLKPSNVMLVTQRGSTHIKILDFGIAALADRDQPNQEKLTQTGFVSGTPDYMAPEQAVGDPNIGPPADIFALGIIAFEMFSGRRPFEGATMESLLARVTKGAPSLREVVSDAAFPPDLFRIVDKMLAREVKDRYPDAGALLDDLGRFPTLQTTPDFVPPAELLKRYATASQPAYEQLPPADSATAEGVATVSAREAARPGYAPPAGERKKSAWWIWVVALLVLGGTATGLVLALNSGGSGPAVAQPTAAPPPTVLTAPERPTPPPLAASAALPGLRPPLDEGFTETRLPVGPDELALALPDVAPPLWRPMAARLSWQAAGKPLALRSGSVRVVLARPGEAALPAGSSEGIGRIEDGRLSLDLPPRPLAERFELALDLELLDGQRVTAKALYDARTHTLSPR